MKILSAEQLKALDGFTIKNEPIASIDLMERAAQRCVDWFKKNFDKNTGIKIFCGNGNNGGDGLAIARLLLKEQYASITVYTVETGKKNSEDNETNLKRLHKTKSAIIYTIKGITDLPEIKKDEIIIDALFGIGLNKPVEGLSAQVIEHVNKSKARVVSIDMPSGLPCEPTDDKNLE